MYAGVETLEGRRVWSTVGEMELVGAVAQEWLDRGAQFVGRFGADTGVGTLLWVVDPFGDGTVMKFELFGPGGGAVYLMDNQFKVAITGTDDSPYVSVTGDGGWDGRAVVSDLFVGGSLDQLHAPGMDLAGRLTVTSGVKTVELYSARGSAISIGGTALGPRVVDVTIVDVVETTLSSCSHIDELTVGGWYGDAWSIQDPSGSSNLIVAPSIGTITVGGADWRALFEVDVVLTGAEGAYATLGAFRTSGHLGGGHWSVYGETGAIVAGSVGAEWRGVFTGRVERVEVAGDFAGILTAESMGRMSVEGNMSGATIHVTRGGGGMGLQSLWVGGWLERTDLVAGGDLGTLSAGGMRQTNVVAGVNAWGSEDGQVVDFDPAGGVGKVRVRGIVGNKTAVTNVTVMAPEVGSVQVREARAAVGKRELHLMADRVGSFKRVTPGAGAWHWRGGDVAVLGQAGAARVDCTVMSKWTGVAGRRGLAEAGVAARRRALTVNYRTVLARAILNSLERKAPFFRAYDTLQYIVERSDPDADGFAGGPIYSSGWNATGQLAFASQSAALQRLLARWFPAAAAIIGDFRYGGFTPSQLQGALLFASAPGPADDFVSIFESNPLLASGSIYHKTLEFARSGVYPFSF